STSRTRSTTATRSTTRTRPSRPPERRRAVSRASADGVDDAQLVAGAIAGRHECFETLVERHQRPVHALVYRWLGDHAVADEVVQATFVRAYTHLVDFRGDASFRSWLCGIAINQVRTLQRSRRRERTVPIDDVPEGDLPQVEGTTVSGRLRDKLADLVT